MHPACFPPQTQRAQMFSFLSCEGARSPKLIKAQHGRVVNSTAVKERRKRKEKEKRKGKQRQRQSRDRDNKDGEREREKERERESASARVRVRRPSHAFGRASWQCEHTHGSRYVATTLYITKRADQRYTERECAQKEKVRSCLSGGSNR